MFLLFLIGVVSSAPFGDFEFVKDTEKFYESTKLSIEKWFDDNTMKIYVIGGLSAVFLIVYVCIKMMKKLMPFIIGLVIIGVGVYLFSDYLGEFPKPELKIKLF